MMDAKLLVTILFVAALGATLLTLRQQRLDAAHEMVTLHRHIRMQTYDLWESQTKVAEQTEPLRLREMVRDAELNLVPQSAEPDDPDTHAPTAQLPDADRHLD